MQITGKVEDLNRSEFNPRRISYSQIIAMCQTMMVYGDLSGIVFNVRTKRLICGHQRLQLFDPSSAVITMPFTDRFGTVRIGFIHTAFGIWSYREVNWPEKKELLANIAANKTGGEFDDVKMKKILELLGTLR